MIRCGGRNDHIAIHFGGTLVSNLVLSAYHGL
jgi:hypothetical protein